MDVYLNYHSSCSSSVAITKTKSNNTFHGREKGKKKNNNNNKKIIKLSTDPQSVAARERRHKISERFKILRSMIPGGNTKNMDTVSMLEEAVQYVHFLKSQIMLHQTMLSVQYPLNYNHLISSQQQLPQMEYEILPQLSGFVEADQDNYKMADSQSYVIYP